MPPNQRQIIEQVKFAYSLLGTTVGKQTEKHVGTLKVLDTFNKKNKLKQIKGIFPQNLMNDLIRVKLEEIFTLQNIIKNYNVNYK